MKKLFLPLVFIISVLIIIPTAITSMYSRTSKKESVSVTTFRQETTRPDLTIKGESPAVEEYIKGVVAAEMPALFELEALKAQAVASRTYTYKHMEGGIPEPGKIGQAYITVDEMKKKWGANFSLYYKKISDAVDMTAGEIMVYDEEPIEAVFHSTSAGITESSENVWQQPLPYLKSVDSKQDEDAPDFIYETEIEKSRFVDIFKEKYNDLELSEIRILSRTDAGYVKDIKVFNKVLSGKEFREILGLRSSNFILTENGNNIVIKTKGYGHGAGMSQYGANFMARDGKTYKEILKHYYNGVTISDI